MKKSKSAWRKPNPEQEAARLATPRKSRRNVPTPTQYSRDAVCRAADTLVGLGFTREFALETIAYQLHESLLKLKGLKEWPK